ncbi:FlgO family outer membrane protein [Oleidesulfovibrio sp.]|uniref:FlgO family outer membrane protein n=1 Tax=Oleidesulfovibrio sp. TaxID=2909707 RepID=UPI003A846F48
MRNAIFIKSYPVRLLLALASGLVFVAALWCMPAYAVVNGASTRMPESMDSQLAAFAPDSPLTQADFRAADVLHTALSQRLSRNSPILVATLVELNDFEQTSTFGRLVSQQVGSRLGQHGYKVMDVRLGSELVSRRKTGEFMMTRETARMLETRYAAQAVLLGNYVVVRGEVFVSLRVLRLDDRSIVAAHEFSLPNSGTVRAMLSRKSAFDKGAWSRYAMRHRMFSPEKSVLPVQPVVREDAGCGFLDDFPPMK